MRGRGWISLGSLLAGAAVAAGAIGAHALREVHGWPEDRMQTYEVAVRYQMYHALALVVVGVLAGRGNCPRLFGPGCLFLLGIVLFSGGLYAWLFTEIKPFVHVVPIGGLAWIVAWIWLAIHAWGADGEAPAA